MRFENKTIIVTGSTQGIGEAIARQLHAEGANVLLHGLEQDLGNAVASDLGARAAFHLDDLSDPQAPARLIAAALKHFGQIDGLVNNAAIIAFNKFEDSDLAFYDRILAANARAPFLLIQAALPHLAKTHGCVVNIGSVNAHCGEPELVPYAMSKGALMTMTRNLGDSLHREHGVRVNQVNPGWVLTEGERQRKIDCGLPEDWPETIGKEFAASGRLIKPEEIAEGVLYFLSDACGPISGSVVDLEQHPVIGRLSNKS
jgi:NAD(P)-dependent dehydrogenase (short-subunit alcohol dehydrogenase family)